MKYNSTQYKKEYCSVNSFENEKHKQTWVMYNALNKGNGE